MTHRVVVLSLALTLFGCGSDGGAPPIGRPDDVVSHTPSPDPLEPAGPERVEPREGLVDVRATSWDRYRVREGGRALDLFFWSGVEDCYGVDRVEVDYKKQTVEVTIFEGREPAAEVCIELAVRKVVQVALEEEIGDRKVVDGRPEG